MHDLPWKVTQSYSIMKKYYALWGNSVLWGNQCHN